MQSALFQKRLHSLGLMKETTNARRLVDKFAAGLTFPGGQNVIRTKKEGEQWHEVEGEDAEIKCKVIGANDVSDEDEVEVVEKKV